MHETAGLMIPRHKDVNVCLVRSRFVQNIDLAFPFCSQVKAIAACLLFAAAAAAAAAAAIADDDDGGDDDAAAARADIAVLKCFYSSAHIQGARCLLPPPQTQNPQHHHGSHGL
jgi:hypothetical protein